MESRIDFIRARVEENLLESGVDENGEGVLELRWKEWPAGTVPDPVTGAMPGSANGGCEKIPAFVHFVSAAAVVRQFAEVQTGDVIADISPEVNLQVSCTGAVRQDLRFVVSNVEYVSRPLSDQLATFWDVQQSGVKLFQTVLLRKAT